MHISSLYYLIPLLSLSISNLAEERPQRHPQYEAPMKSQTLTTQNYLKDAVITSSPHWQDHIPQIAIDGKIDQNYWAAENLPVWLQLDLKKDTTLNTLKVYPYYSDGRIYKYKVEGSCDGQKWLLLGDKINNTKASNRDGDTFTFEQQKIRFIKITFLANSAGNQFGGHLIEIEGFNSTEKDQSPSLFPVSKLKRYHRTQKPQPVKNQHIAWRGERYNWQLYLQCNQETQHLRFVESSLFLTSHNGEKIPLQASFIRYTLSNNQPVGDILDPELPITISQGTGRPIWLSADIPSQIQPGIYQGNIQLVANGQTFSCPISLKVLSATLPKPKDWKIHLDLWQHPEPFARWHQVPLWSKEHFDLMRPSMERLAQAGQKVITCTLINEAWNAQTYDWFSSMITWTKKRNGTWSYDYTNFDRWVEFMMSCGITEQISCYTMIPWSLTFRFFDETSGKIIDQKLQPGSPEYNLFWQSFLIDFTRHLKEKGWLNKTAIAMDERPDYLLRPAVELVKKYAPELKMVSAVDRPSSLTESFYDVSIAYQHSQSEQRLLKDRQARGLKTTCYVCCYPQRPNTFTFSAPVESHWLPLSMVAMGYDGFLRWAYNSWVKDPFESTDFTSWPSGDCFLIYPGNRSSIRFENLRDGCEDFEKILFLRGQNHPKITELDQFLKEHFDYKKSTDKPEEQIQSIKKLHQLLNQFAIELPVE